MLEDKICTLEEMRSLGIDTHEYVFMDQPGEATGVLVLKAETRSQSRSRNWMPGCSSTQRNCGASGQQNKQTCGDSTGYGK